MPRPTGFSYEHRANGEVVIRHHGRVATVLRGRKATAFLDDAGGDDDADQDRMARVTGDYRRGNERHPTAVHRRAVV